ncbi:MAG: cytochrome-c peroxidase [Anaerolineae bacterium]|nr:cytochrome-c peroxidase [Anaerolineae bacterium]
MKRFILLIALLLLTACAGSAGPRTPSALDNALRQVITAEALTGDPSLGRELPAIDDPLAQLGKQLFFTKALSGDMDVACASCHHPLLAGGDGLAVGVGIGSVEPDMLGPGRSRPDGLANVPRNAPTTFNIGLWDEAMFWDGRVESLGKTAGLNGSDDQGICTPDEHYLDADPLAGPDLVSAQSRFPVTSQDEMRGKLEQHKPNWVVRDHLLGRLGNYGTGAGELATNGWLTEFHTAFDLCASVEELISDENVSAAIGAYQRSQIFVDTPWRAYVQGDLSAIDDAAKRGALLFYQTAAENGADCASCHTGDFFTDEQYYALAVPQVGPGKDDGTYRDDDYGRFRVSGEPADLYAFRTPTLLNVAATGPYGHDGAYATLEGIVRQHLDPAAAVAAYDAAQLNPTVQTEHMAYNTARALAKLEENRSLGLPAIEPMTLTDAQIADLVAFMETLTDPCVTDPACLAPWVPGADDPDPDGLRLNASMPSLE